MQGSAANLRPRRSRSTRRTRPWSKRSCARRWQREAALERSRIDASQMNLAQAAWEAGQPSRTVELLETLRPWPGEFDIRGFEWYYLYHLNYGNRLRSWRSDGDGIAAVAWSRDGTLIATASASSSVRLWDARTGDHRRDLPHESGSGRIDLTRREVARSRLGRPQGISHVVGYVHRPGEITSVGSRRSGRRQGPRLFAGWEMDCNRGKPGGRMGIAGKSNCGQSLTASW